MTTNFPEAAVSANTHEMHSVGACLDLKISLAYTSEPPSGSALIFREPEMFHICIYVQRTDRAGLSHTAACGPKGQKSDFG